MNRTRIEWTVGLFMIVGILCLAYLSAKLGKTKLLGHKGYEVHAFFSDVGGLRSDAAVVIAGVDIGRVQGVALEDYKAHVVMEIYEGVALQEDAIASIKTRGLSGEQYIEITPGGSQKTLRPGDHIRDTQPAVDLISLISKYVFGQL